MLQQLEVGKSLCTVTTTTVDHMLPHTAEDNIIIILALMHTAISSEAVAKKEKLVNGDDHA